MNSICRAVPVLLLGLAVTSCETTVPVAVVIGANGQILRGTSTASLAGGHFQVSDGKLTCGGSYDALDMSVTISMPVQCSDGRTGIVIATRQGGGLDGSGHVRLSDGTVADFVFGSAAAAFQEPPSSPRSQPPAPAATVSNQVSELTTSTEPRIVASGSGIIVTRSGDVLTNFHVVSGCGQIRLDRDKPLSIVATDRVNDLALLRGDTAPTAVARFREAPATRSGESVVVAGFPLYGLLASQVNITSGAVSATAGLGNDSRYLQITAPVQAGNSGGALVDASGAVIGIVVAKLDAVKVAGVTGDLPQNVNFAMKAPLALEFMRAANVTPEVTSASPKRFDAPTIGEQAARYTVLLTCWK